MTGKINWGRANRERRMWDRGVSNVADEKERFEGDPAARWLNKSQPAKPVRQQQYRPKSGTGKDSQPAKPTRQRQYKPKGGNGKTKVVPGDGDACPRCRVPMQIREHDRVSDEQLGKRFYYRRWFCCMNKNCKTTMVMPEQYKVMNPGKSSDPSPNNTKPTVIRPDPADPNERPPWE